MTLYIRINIATNILNENGNSYRNVKIANSVVFK